MANEFLRFVHVRPNTGQKPDAHTLRPGAHTSYKVITNLSEADGEQVPKDAPTYGIKLPLPQGIDPILATKEFEGIRNRLAGIVMFLESLSSDEESEVKDAITELELLFELLSEANQKVHLLSAAWDYFAASTFEDDQPNYAFSRRVLLGAEAISRGKPGHGYWSDFASEILRLDFFIPTVKAETHALTANVVAQSSALDTSAPTKSIAFGDRTKIVPNYSTTLMVSDSKPIKARCCNVSLNHVAEFNRLEYTVARYEPGEIAHIENLMQGEYKERLTRHLDRFEEENTFEQESEQESFKDSQTTDRLELEKETERQFAASLEAEGTYTKGNEATPVKVTASLSTSVSYSTHTRELAKTMQEVVSRALQRIKTRTLARRTTQRLEEFEDTSKHGMDNRGGTTHVTGIYRWIDKVIKVDLVNYGKRVSIDLILENPARQYQGSFDQLSVASIPKPEDVTFDGTKLSDAGVLTEANYLKFAAVYGARVKAPIPAAVQVAKTHHVGPDGQDSCSGPTIPSGYEGVSARVDMAQRGKNTKNDLIIAFDGEAVVDAVSWEPSSKHYVGELSFSFGAKAEASVATISVNCSRTNEAYQNWQIETYDAIISAYNDKLAEAQRKVAAANRVAKEQMPSHPARNKRLVEEELRKLCIWSIGCGMRFWQDGDWANYCQSVPSHLALLPTNSEENCKRLRMAKMLESAIDWQLMAYSFLPYFYAPTCLWEDKLNVADPDPMFEEFLKAGAARVSIPFAVGKEGVREVLYLLSTGHFWMIDSPPPLVGNFANLAAEQDALDEMDPTVEESWEIRLPTTLTLLECGNACINSEEVASKITGLDTAPGSMKPLNDVAG